MSYCEIPTFYEVTEPVARKEHGCCECDAPILPREKYVVAVGKWDGEVRRYRQHLLCANACRFVRDNLNGGDCICFGGLEEWVAESKWQTDRAHPIWREFRKMVADIKRREHGCLN